MRSERLRWLVNADGPFASVYFDDSHDTLDAAEQLETRWRDIRRHFEDLGAGVEILRRLEEAVLRHRPAVGRRGRGVIATSDQVLINEQLITPPPTTVMRLSDYPYIMPLLDLEMQRPTYVFAAVDHAGADVTLYRGGAISSTRIEGAGYPVHKPVTAGWKGYGDYQHTTQEAIRMNCRAVADHLTRLADEWDPEVVFVCGEVRSRADVIAELPGRVTRRVSQLHAEARKIGIDSDEIRLLTAAEFDRGSGLAAEGLTAVCAALRDGGVDTLIIGELGDATVVTGKALTRIAPDADALSDFGEPVERVARADEALPFSAIAVGASLMRADTRIAPIDGVGALLRYVATDRLASQQV
jgi:Bacterial archaeo-eukaryotic release factor family 2